MGLPYGEIVEEIAGINRESGAPDLTLPLTDLLRSREKFIYLAVFGQFKSGKSSLINHILGSNILPVGVVPVTAIVTRIRYAEKPGLIIIHHDGSQSTHPLEDLPQFVTERYNPENIKNISQAIAEHPVMEPCKNINLVDTPGLGSFYKHNSRATRHWLPFTGAALVCVSAERPLSEEDIKLIKGISQYCPQVTVVITKSDLFNPGQLSEIKEYISNALQSALKHPLPVFTYSVIPNTPYSGNQLIDQVIRPLQSGHETGINDIIKHKIKTLTDQSIIYANLAMRSAEKKEREKESIENLLEYFRNNRTHFIREMLLSATAYKSETRQKLEKIILPHIPDITANLEKKLSREYRHWQGFLFQVVRQYEGWLKETLKDEIKSLDQSIRESIDNIVQEPAGYFQYSSSQFRLRLDEKLHEFFGVHLPEIAWQPDFNGIDQPDISVYRTFDSHIDTLFFFVPAGWIKKPLGDHFHRQISIEADKNLHRYISALTGKILQVIDEMHQQALSFLGTEFDNVNKILEKEDSNLDSLKENILRLEEIKGREDTTG